jgi:hypothetical protein
MTQTTFAPGSVITNRNRLWRVDAQAGEVLVAMPIDGGETEPPSPEIVRHHFFFTPGFRLILAPRSPYPDCCRAGYCDSGSVGRRPLI